MPKKPFADFRVLLLPEEQPPAVLDVCHLAGPVMHHHKHRRADPQLKLTAGLVLHSAAHGEQVCPRAALPALRGSAVCGTVIRGPTIKMASA